MSEGDAGMRRSGRSARGARGLRRWAPRMLLLGMASAWAQSPATPAAPVAARSTASPAAAAPIAPAASGPWRELLATDLAFVRRTLETRHVYAVYPGGASWREVHDPAVAEAESALADVRDFPGYRAVLSRFAGRFADPHLRLSFALQPASYQWPGFTLRHRGGHFVVTESRVDGVTAGTRLDSCDGRLAAEWLDELAVLEGEVPGLESTRAQLAPRLLLDSGNPLRRRPTACRIGGADVTLAWSPIPAERWAALAALRGVDPEPPAGISALGARGAWIRLPTMTPRDTAQAETYHRIIGQLPALRDHDVIVFDVRGNGGGSYNWFMAMLRALYGEPAARYYARERLRIRPVFVGGIIKLDEPSAPAADPLGTPRDAELDAVVDHVHPLRLADGNEVMVMDARDERRRARPRGAPPPARVRAQVYVLTDHGCASACLSFIDELLQFPGARQVGTATAVDRRSGSPVPHRLPSGAATLLVPSMVRERRARGENVPWVPATRFDGDIADTTAVQRWLLQDVWPADVAARAHTR